MRKKLAILTALALAVLATGCGPADSLFALYTADDKVFDERLLGAWTDAEGAKDKVADLRMWKFDKSEDGLSYDVTVSSVDPEEKGRILTSARLVRLGDFLFIDFETPDWGKRGMTDALLPVVPAHYFGRIDLDGQKVHIGLLDDYWVEKQRKAGTLPLAVIEVSGSRLLTAKTEDLRKFALGHAGDKDAFGSSFDLGRVK